MTDKLNRFRMVSATAVFSFVTGTGSLAYAGNPSLTVEPAERLIMDDVVVEVEDVIAGSKVTIEAHLEDDGGQSWSSRGVYYADEDGRVDVAATASVCGTYSGIDAEGLFWSMLPATVDQLSTACDLRRDEKDWPRHPSFSALGDVVVELVAKIEPLSLDGEPSIVRSEQRILFSRPGVQRQEISDRQIRGILFTPGESRELAVVLVITGSGGGADERSAALLASHGFASMALAHFNYQGRPRELAKIPLEYFRDSMDWMRRRFDQRKVALFGRSRGGEAVLLVASTYPEMISAVIAGVPTNMVNSGCCSPEAQKTSAWTFRGQPMTHVSDRPRMVNRIDHEVYSEYGLRRLFLPSMLASNDSDPRAIKVENIRAPILLQSGGADEVWPSRIASERIVARLERHDFEFAVTHSTHSGAGHRATSEELITSLGHMVRRSDSEARMLIGGFPAGNAQAMKRFFHERIRFLKENTRS